MPNANTCMSVQVVLVMEYVEKGALFEDSAKCEPLDQRKSRLYFRDIISGLAYLHVHGVVHCDIKPQNLVREPRSLLSCPFVLMISLSKPLPSTNASVVDVLFAVRF